MSEPTFLQQKMTLNGFQDPMGDEAHDGLQKWMDKFHQPGVPSHTIITDPDYYVFLWFHNALGNLIECPYIKGGYKTLTPGSKDMSSSNAPFYDQKGIQGGITNDVQLNKYCVDLTPFVREATLPDIAPANGAKITTLFGETTAGAFSPYASDGSKNITLNMLDTEYSILDAIFYPWMKDINSPWWYRPDAVYSEWATPYPMATLEVQRPRMRYAENPKVGQSRTENEYKYYSYRFIGVKPVSYAPFEVNSAGRSSLIRTLTLICDMCIVDLTHDARITTAESANLGNRTSFIFSDMPPSSGGGDGDSPENPEDSPDAQLPKAEGDLGDTKDAEKDNDKDKEKQGDGEQPGEEEPEWEPSPDNPDEYPDDYGDDEEDDPEDPDEEDDPDDEEPEDDEPEEKGIVDKVKDLYDKAVQAASDKLDEMGDFGKTVKNLAGKVADAYKKVWDFWYKGSLRKVELDVWHDIRSNTMLYEQILDREANRKTSFRTTKKDTQAFERVMDTLIDLGDDIALQTSVNMGWVGNGIDFGYNVKPGVEDFAVGIGVDIMKPTSEVVSTSDNKLKVNSNVVQDVVGVAANLASTVIVAAAKYGSENDRNVVVSYTDYLGVNKGVVSTPPFDAFGVSTSELARYLGGIDGMFTKEPVQNIWESGEPAMPNEDVMLYRLNSTLGSIPYSGTTAFGVVYDSDVGEYNKTTKMTLVGGVVPKRLSAAFPYLVDSVSYWGNSLGGSMQKIKDTSDVFVAKSLMKDITRSMTNIRMTNTMVANMNQQTKDIAYWMYDIGEIMTNILGVKSDVLENSIGGLGKVLRRMGISNTGKPTPIESYVGIIAKTYTNNSSM